MATKSYKVIQGQNLFDYLSDDEKSEMFSESEFGALAVNQLPATGTTSVAPGSIVMLTSKSPVWSHLDSATKRNAVTVKGPDRRPLPKSFGYDYFNKLLPTGDSIFASRSRGKWNTFRVQFSTDLDATSAAKLMSVFDFEGADVRISADNQPFSAPTWHKGLTPVKMSRLVRQAGAGLESFSVAFKGDSIISWSQPDPDRKLLNPPILEAVEAAYGANKAQISFTSDTFNSLSFGVVGAVFAAQPAARHVMEAENFVRESQPREGHMIPLADAGLSLTR